MEVLCHFLCICCAVVPSLLNTPFWTGNYVVLGVSGFTTVADFPSSEAVILLFAQALWASLLIVEEFDV